MMGNIYGSLDDCERQLDFQKRLPSVGGEHLEHIWASFLWPIELEMVSGE